MNSRSAHVRHLISRFRELGRPVTTHDDDAAFASRVLTPGELALWNRMDAVDRRHSVEVARRFCALLPSAGRDEVAAALLHDVGKSAVRLGRVGRSIATIAGLTSSMRTYRRHEAIGEELLRAAGVSARTVELAAGRVDDDAGRALRSADDGRQ